eukprot:707023-Prymnesium_polylepis.1
MFAWAIAAVAFDVSQYPRQVPKARAPPPTAASPQEPWRSPVERRRDLSRLQYSSGIITDDKRES